MNVTSALSQANYGTPIKKVVIIFRKKRKGFEEISEVLSDFGHATDTVLKMKQLTWYVTDRGYLVSSESSSPDLGNDLTVHLIMDENLAWLIERSDKKHWKDFGVPVRITMNELDRVKVLTLLSEQPQYDQAIK